MEFLACKAPAPITSGNAEKLGAAAERPDRYLHLLQSPGSIRRLITGRSAQAVSSRAARWPCRRGSDPLRAAEALNTGFGIFFCGQLKCTHLKVNSVLEEPMSRVMRGRSRCPPPSLLLR